MTRNFPPLVAITIAAGSAYAMVNHGEAVLLVQDFENQFLAPSLDNPFGTDRFGRDVFVYALAGLGSSIRFAMMAIVFAAVVGITWGAAWRLQDSRPLGAMLGEVNAAFLSVPPLIVVLAILLVTGGERAWVSLLVGLLFAPYLARIIHRDLTDITNADYFIIERLFGLSFYNSFLRIALPRSVRVALPTLIVLTSDIVALDAALSFLGLSLQPPAAGIGQLLRQGITDVNQGWWICAGAALLLAVFVVDLNRYAFRLTASLR